MRNTGYYDDSEEKVSESEQWPYLWMRDSKVIHQIVRSAGAELYRFVNLQRAASSDHGLLSLIRVVHESEANKVALTVH